MKYHHRWFAAVAGIIALSASTSEAALVNAGFETGNYSGWIVGGTASRGVAVDGTSINGYPDNVVNVHTGNFAAWGEVAISGSPPQYLTLAQTVSVASGATYDVGFWLSIGSNIGSAGRAYNVSVDGTTILRVNSFGLSGSDYWYGTGPSDYLHESALYTAGIGQTSATVTYWLSGSGTGEVGFSYDDFHFTPVSAVPVPAAVWLFGSGLLGLVSLIRRKAA